MKRILVVDDDPQIVEMLNTYLTGEGFEVQGARDIRAARGALEPACPDLVLLDLMLDQDDGWALGREMHQRGIPFLIVTARQDVVDRIAGLEMGAEDFVSKPFDLRELLARIRVVLRRAHEPAATQLERSDVLSFQGWRLNAAAFELTDPAGKSVELTSTELMLLQTFARNPGRLLTRNQISTEVLHRDWTAGDRSVDMLVSKLRGKIEPDSRHPTFIKTRRGLGYVFTTTVTTEPG